MQGVKCLLPRQVPHLDREAATRSALRAGELGYFGGGTGGPSTLTGGGGVSCPCCRLRWRPWPTGHSQGLGRGHGGGDPPGGTPLEALAAGPVTQRNIFLLGRLQGHRRGERNRMAGFWSKPAAALLCDLRASRSPSLDHGFLGCIAWRPQVLSSSTFLEIEEKSDALNFWGGGGWFQYSQIKGRILTFQGSKINRRIQMFWIIGRDDEETNIRKGSSLGPRQ